MGSHELLACSNLCNSRRTLLAHSGHTRRLSYNTRKYGLVDEIQCILGPLTTAMPQLHHIYQPP